MKSKSAFKVITIFMLILIMLSNFAFAEEAEEYTNENDLLLINQEGENFNDTVSNPNNNINESQEDLYLAEEKVEVEKVINGNVFIIASDVKITSEEIRGNVFILAQNVDIEKTSITGSVFIVAEKLNFNAFAQDAYIVSQDANITKDGRIVRDLRIATQNLKMDGFVSRNVFLVGETIEFLENAIIEGNLNYTAPEELSLSGKILGEINYTELEEEEYTVKDKISDYVQDILSSIIYSILIILFAICVIPKFSKNINNMKFFECFGLGIGFLFVVPIITIILFVTVIGILPALLLLAMYVIMLTIGYTISALAIADKIYKKINAEGNSKLHLFLITILTLIVLNIISLIPVLGEIISFVLTMIGDGIVISSIIKSR